MQSSKRAAGAFLLVKISKRHAFSGSWTLFFQVILAVHTSSGEIQNFSMGGFPENRFPVEGVRLFFGDIALGEDQIQALEEKSCTVTPDKFWKAENGEVRVPYAFNSSADWDTRNLMPEVERHYSENTCIRLYEVDISEPIHKIVINRYAGCWSYLGKNEYPGYYYQLLSIGPGCAYLSIIIHEFGHAVGMLHEQCRPDRDEYLSLDLNMVEESQRHNYRKSHDCNTYGVKYDYSSVMQYRYNSFSPTGEPVMATKEVKYQYILGEAQGFSHRDKLLLNRAYKCSAHWGKSCGVEPERCQNDGYLGKDCKCVCPRGTRGDYCQELTGESYYPDNPQNCGGEVTQDGTTLGAFFERGQCIWEIKAPHGKRVRFTITKAHVTGSCYHAALNVRFHDPYYSYAFCSNDRLYKGLSYLSSGQTLILHWVNQSGYKEYGFEAKIEFV